MSSTSTRTPYGFDFGSLGDMGGVRAPFFDGNLNGTGDFVSILSSAQSKGIRLILKFPGASGNYTDPTTSAYSFPMWKTWMDKAHNKIGSDSVSKSSLSVQMANFVKTGALIGGYLADDITPGGQVFPGGIPTFNEMESMASYPKGVWPSVPCVIRAENTYFETLGSHYTYLDFGWAQWSWRFGAAETYLTNNINAGKRIGLGLLFGFNLVNGGSGLTAPWNIHAGTNRPTRFGMSPQELDAIGDAFHAHTEPIGIFGWSAAAQYDPGDYYDWPSIQTALTRITDFAVGRTAGPTNQRAPSTTSTPTDTVFGTWALLSGGGYYRTGEPANPIPIPIPTAAAGNMLGVLAYSKDYSLKSATCPSGWSEAKRISGNSAQGGDLALFVKIAAGNEGSTVNVQFAGSGNDTACMGQGFGFSGNTDKIAGLIGTTGSAKSWSAGSSKMGPVAGVQSNYTNALVLVCAAKTNDFMGSTTSIDAMSYTTSGGESWNRAFITGNGTGSDSGMFMDYSALSGRPSIVTKSWSQLTKADSTSSGAGCGFMVTFAPGVTVLAAQLPLAPSIRDFDDVTMSVASTLSFTMSVTGTTPITYSVLSGPSNITLGSSTGAFQWSPLATGTYVIDLRATNSTGSDTDGFVATIVPSTTTASGGTILSGNTAPVITNPGNQTVNAQERLSFVVVSTDSDGDAIAYSLSADAPAGTFIDQDTGQFVWIPSGDQGPGTYAITINATDGQNLSLSTFTVTVNDALWTRIGGPAPQLGKMSPSGNQFRRI